MDTLSSSGCYSMRAIARIGPSGTVRVTVSSATTSEEDPKESSYHGISLDRDSQKTPYFNSGLAKRSRL